MLLAYSGLTVTQEKTPFPQRRKQNERCNIPLTGHQSVFGAVHSPPPLPRKILPTTIFLFKLWISPQTQPTMWLPERNFQCTIQYARLFNPNVHNIRSASPSSTSILTTKPSQSKGICYWLNSFAHKVRVNQYFEHLGNRNESTYIPNNEISLHAEIWQTTISCFCVIHTMQDSAQNL